MTTTIQAMKLYGGSFVRALADAMMIADNDNRKRIETAFPEIMQRYAEMAKARDDEYHRIIDAHTHAAELEAVCREMLEEMQVWESEQGVHPAAKRARALLAKLEGAK